MSQPKSNYPRPRSNYQYNYAAHTTNASTNNNNTMNEHEIGGANVQNNNAHKQPPQALINKDGNIDMDARNQIQLQSVMKGYFITQKEIKTGDKTIPNGTVGRVVQNHIPQWLYLLNHILG